MPRILCLHGHGTSSKIFESQLQGLRRQFTDDYELVFADGEVECDRAPAIPHSVPGPFLCYFNNTSSEDLRAAHELLGVIIDEEGPFDGVFAFSQGASLTISYLLELERQQTSTRAPFNFAILFSPPIALSPDHDFCADSIVNITSQDFDFFADVIHEASGSQTAAQCSVAQQRDLSFPAADVCQYQIDPSRRQQVLISSVADTLRAGVKCKFLEASQFQSLIEQRDTSIIPRVLHPALLRERIQIPTVHITGSKDDKDLQSQFAIMPLLCKKGSVRRVVHSGGHDLPRILSEINEVVKAVESAVEESRMLVF